MNIKELRAVMEAAFREVGLEQRHLFPRGLKVWSLPADDIIRFFLPHPYRRPWGFVYAGAIGIEIPTLREWLRNHKAGEKAGIFQSCFTSYLTINEEVRRDFMVEHGNPIPAAFWAALIKRRLAQVPPTLDSLIAAYRRDKERLGWLTHPHAQHAWEFLLKWHDDPDPSLRVPQMLPDGRII